MVIILIQILQPSQVFHTLSSSMASKIKIHSKVLVTCTSIYLFVCCGGLYLYKALLFYMSNGTLIVPS